MNILLNASFKLCYLKLNKAAMDWMNWDLSTRKSHLQRVFENVRFPLMTAKFLVGTVDKNQLIRTDGACRDLVDEAKNYLLLPQERGHMQGPRTRPRRPVNPYEGTFSTYFILGQRKLNNAMNRIWFILFNSLGAGRIGWGLIETAYQVSVHKLYE